MQSLREALENSGVVEEVQKIADLQENDRRARNDKLGPHQRWWQNFRMTATKFEVKIFIKVQCTQWTEGLDFIAARKLNSVTTRCRTKDEAIDQLRAKIFAWQRESILDGNEPPAGSLLYWRIY